jgi:hypothetical protein
MLKMGYCSKFLKSYRSCNKCIAANKCNLSIICPVCGNQREKDISYYITLECKHCHDMHFFNQSCTEISHENM